MSLPLRSPLTPGAGVIFQRWTVLCAVIVLLVSMPVVGGEVQVPSPPAAKKSTIPARLFDIGLRPRGKITSWGSRQVGVVSFYHGGNAAGQDIIVTDKTGRQQHRILQAGPGTFLRLAFSFADADTVTVHFGMPKGVRLEEEPRGKMWQPDAGLLLTLWQLPDGSMANSWQQMQKLLEKVERKLGSDFVGNVFHGYQVFPGTGEGFVSVYEGWLGVPVDGEYIFVTSSDDASFLCIDNKEVISWPGIHGAAWDARHQKKVKLPKGIHHFAYYHVNFSGPTIAVAAWQIPGEKRPQPITAASFAPVATFEVTKANRGTVLTVVQVGMTQVEGKDLLRYRFKLVTADKGPVRWSFGDGCTREAGTDTTHIFLTPGVREILTGTKTRNLVSVVADQAWSVKRRLDEAAPYLEEVATYPFGELSPEDLETTISILSSDRERFAAKTAQACATMISREDAAGKQIYAAALLLGKRLRQGEPEKAIEVYRGALKRELSRKAKAGLIRETGDTLFYYQNKLDEALNEYDKVVGRYADVLEANIVRVTKIKIGDIFRRKGDGAKARAAYREAEQLLLYKRNFAQNTVRKGALYKSVDDFLKRKEIPAARKWLEILEWEYPMEKLDGYSSIARARIAEAEGNIMEAEKQFLWFVKANPRCSYSAEAVYRLAVLASKTRKSSDLSRMVKLLKQKYPDSVYAEKAEKLRVVSGQ